MELIRRLGVKFVCGSRSGTDITLNDLDNQYNAVFLAIGTWKESWVYLPGTELKGVHPGAALPRIGRQVHRLTQVTSRPSQVATTGHPSPSGLCAERVPFYSYGFTAWLGTGCRPAWPARSGGKFF